MVSKKPTLLVIAGTLLIAWLLVTSIHPIQPAVSSSGPTSIQQQNSQSGQGGSNNGGGGGGGFGNFSLFRFPQINFSFPDLIHFNWPNFNISWPKINFNWPDIKWPNWGFGTGSGSGSGVGPGSGDGSGNSNGNGGNGGSSNAIQTQTTSHQVQPLFKIPTDVLIAIVIIITIIAGAFLVLRSRNAILNRRKGNSQQLSEAEPVPPVLEVQDAKIVNAPSGYVFQFVGDEMVADFQGWGIQGGFLKPKINESLPLIWSLDEPLEISAPAGATLNIGKDTPIGTSISEAGTFVGAVTFSEPCNIVHGLYQDTRDAKWIRAVHYDEDVMKLFRLNFLIGSKEEEISYGVLTPREIVNKIITEKSQLVKDQSALYPIARIFERAFYGRKKISREEYELYLTSLSKALANPKVIICGPKK